MNRYQTSTGERISEAVINKRLSEAYRRKYEGETHPMCAGCGIKPAQGSAHIIPKTRLKYDLRSADLIYNPELFFAGCHDCNKAIENPKGQNWKKLCNLQECLYVIAKYDPQLYQIFMNNL